MATLQCMKFGDAEETAWDLCLDYPSTGDLCLQWSWSLELGEEGTFGHWTIGVMVGLCW